MWLSQYLEDLGEILLNAERLVLLEDREKAKGNQVEPG